MNRWGWGQTSHDRKPAARPAATTMDGVMSRSVTP